MKRLSCPKDFDLTIRAPRSSRLFIVVGRLAKASRLLLTRLIVTVSGGGTVLQEEGKAASQIIDFLGLTYLTHPNLPRRTVFHLGTI